MTDPRTVIKKSDANAKCRLCDEMIKRGTPRFVMCNIHVSPKIVDLHFHLHCFEKSVAMITNIKQNNRLNMGRS